VIVLDTTDPGALEQVPLARLWSVLPAAKIMQIDSASEAVRVYCCGDYHARGIGELVEIIASVGRAGCLAPGEPAAGE
jgi:hypothetical protein